MATFSGIYKIYIFALRLILTLTPLPSPGWDATQLQAIHGSSSGLPKSLPDPVEHNTLLTPSLPRSHKYLVFAKKFLRS